MLNVHEIQLKLNDSYIFRRFEKIDWKQIASLNMEQLKASTDWSAIEKNLCNILCCHLESEFNQSNLDPNLCKLFQLAQISIDYLLQVRQQIFNELQACKEKVQASNLALSAAVKAKEQAERKLKEWKKDGKKSAEQQHYYRCPACPKTFVNGEYLHGHWQRRHPEYVTLIPSTAAVVSPVQNSPPPSTSTSPIVAPNKEISELKERLQTAEKQLQNEQQLLHSIMDKMDKSSLNLQGMLAQEVEKIRTSLLESAEAPYSPKKVQSSSVQTTPRMFQHTMATSTPSPEPTNTTATNTEVPTTTTPIPSIRSVYKTESVKLVRQATPPDEQSLSSSTSSDSEPEPRPAIEEKKKKSAPPPPKFNRQLLMDRFKSTIENALAQRMRMLGLDLRRKALSTEAFRQLSEKLESSERRPEFSEMRRHFESQLKERLSKTKTKSLDKPLPPPQKPLLTIGKTSKTTPETKKKPSLTLQVALTPPRAPVPTPRSRSGSSTSSLMARDGEAPSFVSNVSQHLESQMKETRDDPVVEAAIPTDDRPVVKETNSQEEDSFSLSSLDAILTELKKPNRFSQASTPVTTPASIKSVQWRVPVETPMAEKKTSTTVKGGGGSWDSFE